MIVALPVVAIFCIQLPCSPNSGTTGLPSSAGLLHHPKCRTSGANAQFGVGFDGASGGSLLAQIPGGRRRSFLEDIAGTRAGSAKLPAFPDAFAADCQR